MVRPHFFVIADTIHIGCRAKRNPVVIDKEALSLIPTSHSTGKSYSISGSRIHQPSYPTVNPVNCTNDLGGKKCPLLKQWHKCYRDNELLTDFCFWFGIYLEACSVDQASLAPKEIHLPLTTKCWD